MLRCFTCALSRLEHVRSVIASAAERPPSVIGAAEHPRLFIASKWWRKRCNARKLRVPYPCDNYSRVPSLRARLRMRPSGAVSQLASEPVPNDQRNRSTSTVVNPAGRRVPFHPTRRASGCRSRRWPACRSDPDSRARPRASSGPARHRWGRDRSPCVATPVELEGLCSGLRVGIALMSSSLRAACGAFDASCAMPGPVGQINAATIATTIRNMGSSCGRA